MSTQNRSTAFRFWLRVALLVYAAGILVYRDAIMDDTFIHLQYARHLRASGALEFNTGEPSLGATSPLWMLVLAGLGATEAAARLASVACGALSVWLFALLARRVCTAGIAAAATCAWAGSLWLVRHAPNGMESTAAVTLVLLAFELRARGAGWWRDRALGATLGGCCLVRPELGLLPVLFGIADVRHADGRRRLRAWLPACLVPCAAWLLFVWWRVGHVVPDTVSAKSGGPQIAAAFAVLQREVGLVGMAHPVELVGILVALVLQVRLEGRRGLSGLGRHRLTPFVLFAVLLGLAYAAMDVQVQPRYLLPALPALVLAGFAAWQAVLGASRRAALVLAVLCLGASAAVSAARVLPATRDYGKGFRPALQPLVAELASRGADVTVATPDIGLVGYTSGARVLDLGGLIEPRVQEFEHRLGYDAMLASGAFLDIGHADFVIDRSRERARFAAHTSRGLRWQALRTTTIPNLGLSRPGPYYYTLYALVPEAAP